MESSAQSPAKNHPELQAVEVLMTDWFRRARESQQIHYACANFFNSLHYYLGIPAILASTAVGTAVFASFQEEVVGYWRVVVGLVSILAAALAALQTFLNSPKRADDHRVTAARYGGIRRTLEMLKTFPPDEANLRRELSGVKEAMDKLAETAPDVPARIKWRIDEKLKSAEHARIYTLTATK